MTSLIIILIGLRRFRSSPRFNQVAEVRAKNTFIIMKHPKQFNAKWISMRYDSSHLTFSKQTKTYLIRDLTHFRPVIKLYQI